MINLYEILQQVLNESVSSTDVIDAIANKQQVIVSYSDEENHAPRKRIIEPYVYGLTIAGNPCVRAYQYEGDTFRGKPRWKLLRLDRITSWQPTNRHFNTTPAANGWPAEGYNEEGDKSMSEVLYQVHFDGDENPDTLKQARAKTERLKNSEPINISQLKEPTERGAITNDKVANKDNYYVNQNQQPVLRGAIDVNADTSPKNKDYWNDYKQASKEKTQQDRQFKKKNWDNTRRSIRNADKYKPNWHTNNDENNEIENI